MIVDSSLTVKELAKLNHIGEYKTRKFLLKYNPMVAFTSSITDSSVKNSIIRHYISDIHDVKEFNNKFYGKWTRSERNKFMIFLFSKNKYKNILVRLTETYSSWDLAELFGVTQHSLRILCSKLEIELKTHNSSKVHLRMKPYIEKAIGYSTVSEYFVKFEEKRYFIDEYCKELSLCIEIDGEWCHSKEYDQKRDEDLKKLGLNVVRIPSTIELTSINEYLNTNYGTLLQLAEDSAHNRTAEGSTPSCPTIH